MSTWLLKTAKIANQNSGSEVTSVILNPSDKKSVIAFTTFDVTDSVTVGETLSATDSGNSQYSDVYHEADPYPVPFGTKNVNIPHSSFSVSWSKSGTFANDILLDIPTGVLSGNSLAYAQKIMRRIRVNRAASGSTNELLGTVTVSFTHSGVTKSDSVQVYAKPAVQVTLSKSTSAPYSTVSNIQYRVNNGSWQNFGSSVSVPENTDVDIKAKFTNNDSSYTIKGKISTSPNEGSKTSTAFTSNITLTLSNVTFGQNTNVVFSDIFVSGGPEI